MGKALVKIAYRQVIDSNSTGWFAKRVFDVSFDEFLLEIQPFKPDKLCMYSEVLKVNARANSLHNKITFAIEDLVRSLNNVIPELNDNLNFEGISFETYHVTLLESDIRDRDAHKVVIIYISNELTLVDTIGDYLILTDDHVPGAKTAHETFTLQLKSGISICSYQRINQTVVAQGTHN